MASSVLSMSRANANKSHNSSMMNSSVSQQVKPITLQGSATIVCEFFKYAVHSILYQRGVYGAESFDRVQKYGITLFLSKQKDINDYFDEVLPTVEKWLACGQLQKLSLIIISAVTGENLEKWDFEVKMVPADGDSTITGGRRREHGKKELEAIQKGIRSVMRQVTATVTFLPLLQERCAFDLNIYVRKDCEIAKGFQENPGEVKIENPETVKLRSFSTSVHRVNAYVTYKQPDD